MSSKTNPYRSSLHLDQILTPHIPQVDSFIPTWEWDTKKKKKKKSEKSEKSSKRSKSGQSSGTNTPNPEGQATLAVPKLSSGGMTSESDTSRPASRNGPTVEEVEDEDA